MIRPTRSRRTSKFTVPVEETLISRTAGAAGGGDAATAAEGAAVADAGVAGSVAVLRIEDAGEPQPRDEAGDPPAVARMVGAADAWLDGVSRRSIVGGARVGGAALAILAGVRRLLSLPSTSITDTRAEMQD